MKKVRENECGHTQRKHIAHGLCGSCYNKMKLNTDPEYKRKFDVRIKKYCFDNRKKRAAQQMARRKLDPAKDRDIALKSKYGLSQKDLDNMIKRQNNQCKICNNVLKYPNIDHCHKTGKIRGILCITCNTGLGKFKDDPNLLNKAIGYLINVL